MLFVRLAPIGFCFMLFFVLAAVAARRQLIAQDGRLYWISAALATGTLLVLISEIASAFDSLDGLTLAVAWMGVDVALAGLIAWKLTADAMEIILAKWQLQGDGATRWLYGLGMGIAVLLGVISWQAPQFVWDCKTYHTPRILKWVQDKSLRPFPTSDVRRVAFDPGAEMASTTLYLLDGSDRPINLTSWFSVITSAILSSFVTELLLKLFSERTGWLWPPEKAQLAAAFCFLLVLTIPEGLIQAISTENDFVTAMWILSVACFSILFLRETNNLFYAGAIGLSLALGICTKATTFIFAAPFLVGVFGVLAWRRFYLPAVKLGGIVIAAVVLLNTPWLLRNYSVFGRPLGPESVMVASVNPSFSPARDLANIFRNLSIYTATPSATVTKALNYALRKLVFCTGRPLDDPTSIFIYQDPNQTLHFSVPGRTSIENGDGFGNVHVWLILAALPIIIFRLPFRNAIGFHSAAVCVGFCLCCAYLRWHPWFFRLQIPLFVLAMPLVAISLVATARGGFIVAVGVLCLVNAGLILGFNTQYPIYAPFLNLTREEHQFGSNQSMHRPCVALAEDIIKRGCTNVLLKCETYDFDYGLWVCLLDRGYTGGIDEFLVTNDTDRLSHWQVTPQTAMVFMGSRPLTTLTPFIDGVAQPPLLEIEYGMITAVYPSPFAGHWSRLIGPANQMQLSLGLNGAEGIGTNKPAAIHFSCKLFDHDDLPLTNNILHLTVDQTAREIDLRSHPVEVQSVVSHSPFVLKLSLAQPVRPDKQAAYISNPKLSWQWAKPTSR